MNQLTCVTNNYAETRAKLFLFSFYTGLSIFLVVVIFSGHHHGKLWKTKKLILDADTER